MPRRGSFWALDRANWSTKRTWALKTKKRQQQPGHGYLGTPLPCFRYIPHIVKKHLGKKTETTPEERHHHHYHINTWGCERSFLTVQRNLQRKCIESLKDIFIEMKNQLVEKNEGWGSAINPLAPSRRQLTHHRAFFMFRFLPMHHPFSSTENIFSRNLQAYSLLWLTVFSFYSNSCGFRLINWFTQTPLSCF